MGTIVERRRKDGTKAYMARIVISRDGQVYHRETQTFDRRPAAAGWMAKREEELAKPGAIEAAKIADNDPTLEVVIDRCTAESEKEIGRTKTQVLRSIKTYPIAKMRCSEIKSADLTAFAKSIEASPATRSSYMSHLLSVFTIAGPMWGYPLDRSEIEAAQIVLRKLGITGKAAERDRRPTLDELEKLMLHFHRLEIRRPSRIKMTRIVAFAIFSTRRQEEICTIRWDDYEPQHSRVLVRDMKNPDEKIGNNIWCDLPDEAVRIINATPRTSDRIFPYNHRTISTDFSRACSILGIEDLRFHDLRHDGISRLFEIGHGGGSIPHVASVSGHRSWSSLQRYTHVRQIGDKYAGWKWIDDLTSSGVRRRRSE